MIAQLFPRAQQRQTKLWRVHAATPPYFIFWGFLVQFLSSSHRSQDPPADSGSALCSSSDAQQPGSGASNQNGHRCQHSHQQVHPEPVMKLRSNLPASGFCSLLHRSSGIQTLRWNFRVNFGSVHERIRLPVRAPTCPAGGSSEHPQVQQKSTAAGASFSAGTLRSHPWIWAAPPGRELPLLLSCPRLLLSRHFSCPSSAHNLTAEIPGCPGCRYHIGPPKGAASPEPFSLNWKRQIYKKYTQI